MPSRVTGISRNQYRVQVSNAKSPIAGAGMSPMPIIMPR